MAVQRIKGIRGVLSRKSPRSPERFFRGGSF
jgi:hypothetical protein